MSHPKPNRIGITGSPGTGKRSVGLELAKITGLEFVSINEYAINHGFGKWSRGEYVVDVERLHGRINTNNRIVSGHLLPLVVPKTNLDLVVVLRCSPALLKRRYKKRRYSKAKTTENLEAEIIGEIASIAYKEYGIHKLVEIDTTNAGTPRAIAKRIIDISKGAKSRPFGTVDWISHIHSARDLRRAVCP